MKTQLSSLRVSVKRWLLFFMISALIVTCWTWPSSTATGSSQFQQRQRNDQSQQEGLPPGHFLSGAQRSEAVLKDIAATLVSIDKRLQTIELAAKDWQSQTQPNRSLSRENTR